MSLSVFLIMFPFCFAVFVSAQSTPSLELGGCVMTETSCPCAEVKPSAKCVNHNGGNKCSLGNCKPSYQCDCLGYEMCKRSKCAFYQSDNSVIPSNTDSFACHLGTVTAVCTTLDYVMDTLEAVNNMHTAVFIANDESVASMMEAYKIVAEIEDDILAVNDALKNMGSFRNRMTTKEREQIETQAEAVISMVADSGKLALKASQEAEKVYQASRRISEIRHLLSTAASDEKSVEQALHEAKQGAGDNGEECSNCASLEAELERIRNARKEMIKDAADISKKSRESNWNAGKHRDETLLYRSRAAEGKQGLLSKIDEIKKRVIDVNI